MIWPFGKKSASAIALERMDAAVEKSNRALEAARREACWHDNWECTGATSVGSVTCIDCGEEIRINDAINRLRDRMVEAIERAN